MRNVFKVGIAGAALWMGGLAAGTATVSEVVALVRSSIGRHEAAKSLAKALQRLVLTEKMDERFVEELESEGAGPDAVAQLEAMREASARLRAPEAIPPFQSPSRPTTEEQRSFFHEMNQAALHYSRNLPNFICTEVVRRYEYAEPRNTRSITPVNLVAGFGGWRQIDTLAVKLTYFENREKYELLTVNGKRSNKAYEAVGGAISEGDFGSILLEIFSPESRTTFRWDHWTHLRKRLTRVYAYSTRREYSHYKIGVGDDALGRITITAGRRGFVYGDDETHMVVRITGEAENIPVNFPVISQASVLDYDFADVGGQKFLVPLREDVRMKTRQIQFKNMLEFRDYRKFAGETSISFDLPAGADTPEPGVNSERITEKEKKP